MARLTTEEWIALRRTWENDPREGYAWLERECGLGVSKTAIRKIALRDGWKKTAAAQTEPPKVSKVPEVSKVSRESVRKPRKLSTREHPENRAVKQFVEEEDLSPRMLIFAKEYVKDSNGTRAAIAAGYSPRSAAVQATRLLANPGVQAVIRAAVEQRMLEKGMEPEDIVRRWTEVALLDMSEFVELRRVPCEYCYSEDGEPLMTEQDYFFKQKEHNKERAARRRIDPDDDIGEFPPKHHFKFVDLRKRPDPDCKFCFGVGREMRILKDTRDLSPAARYAFCGVEDIKGSLNVLTLSKANALENLAKHLGVYRDKEAQETAAGPTEAILDALHEKIMGESASRQRRVDVSRGFIDAEDIEEVVPPEEE